MGPELNPTRTLAALIYQHGGPLTITGGDLTTGQLFLGGIIITGGNKLILNGPMSRSFGYVVGPSSGGSIKRVPGTSCRDERDLRAPVTVAVRRRH